MRLLLDTQALLWALAGDERLAGRTRGLVESGAEAVFVSLASLWEVVVKVRIGKLRAVPAEIAEGIAAAGFRPLPVTAQHLLALERLPVVEGHRDPFDHLLLAQARSEGLVLVTDDGWAPRYGVEVLRCAGG